MTNYFKITCKVSYKKKIMINGKSYGNTQQYYYGNGVHCGRNKYILMDIGKR